MVLLWTILTSSACARQEPLVTEMLHETLFPYRDQAGRFGYADENLQIQIEPQYKSASLFNEQGFAVVTDSLGRAGVIDKNNRVMIPAAYDNIHLFALKDFTLAEVRKTYYSRWRFWEWKFLPGFNLMGGGNDNRLFDTKVKRLKKTVFILGNENKKIRSERVTVSGYTKDYFDINTLDSNQVLIDGTLYDIGAKGARSIVGKIKEPLTEHTFAQQKGQRLYIIDRKGKKAAGNSYKLLDSIEFKVKDLPLMVYLTKDNYQSVASAYEGEEGHIFIYPDLSKPLPRFIHDNMHTADLTAEEILRGLQMIASVPGSDSFLFMSYHHGERFFWFLDIQGNWHQTLPSGIPFTVTLPSGDILWPAKEHYIPQDQIPDNWEIRRINQLSDGSLYHVTIRRDRTIRQGIWDFTNKQWLIVPKDYQVYQLGKSHQQWRFQSEKDGLWGVMDNHGNVLIKPTYYSISPDGWVVQQENGKYISFYLDLPTRREFRKK